MTAANRSERGALFRGVMTRRSFIGRGAGRAAAAPVLFTVAGLVAVLPTFAFTLLYWLPPEPSAAALWYWLAVGYCALLMAFFGGIRWGFALARDGTRGTLADLAVGLLPLVVAWGALAPPPVVGTSLLIAGFLLQALWDLLAAQDGRLPDWYGRMRVQLTALIVLALLAILGKLVLPPA